MSHQQRRQRQKDDLRQLILDKARELFANLGFQGLSMRRLAQMIDYSPTTIYLYFKDKDELIQAVCAETFQSLIQGLEALAQAGLDPRARLRAAMLGYVDFGVNNPHHYQVAFVTKPSLAASPGEFLQEDNPGWHSFALFREVVGQYLAWAGLNQDLDLAAQGLWAAMHGLASLFISRLAFPWKDRQTLSEHLVDTLLAGLETKAQTLGG